MASRWTDVVVVGGGIAGAALAAVLARRGVGVTVLERQPAYRDRVRGEFLALWGVAEARRLGLVDVLVGTGGALVTKRVPYDEAWPAEVAVAATRDNARVLPGVPGAICTSHPAACDALCRAAAAAGARVTFRWLLQPTGCGDERVRAGGAAAGSGGGGEDTASGCPFHR